MKFELTLNQEDYVNLKLFAASKSKLIKRRRRTIVIILGSCFLVMSASSYLGGGVYMSWWEFLIFGFLFLILYSFYQRRLYRNHFKKIITETHKNRFGKPAQIEFLEDQLLTSDEVGESKINLSYVKEIYETNAYFFMKFETEETLIIPKSQVPVEEFRQIFKQIVARYKVPFSEELDWKFK